MSRRCWLCWCLLLIGAFGHESVAAPGANNVVALYSGGTLLLTGDSYDNTVTLSFQNGFLFVTGTNGTTINGLPSSFGVLHTGPLAMSADFRGGNDSFTIDQATVNISTLQFGLGNDSLTVLNRSTVAINLFDGGAGSERIRAVNSSLRIKTFRNFP